MNNLFDVVAVRFDNGRVCVLDTNQTHRNAEAIRDMAVLRRGLEESFYSEAPAGMYQDGDKWIGYGVDDRDEPYPDDRDDYAREQAIEDGRMEYER